MPLHAPKWAFHPRAQRNPKPSIALVMSAVVRLMVMGLALAVFANEEVRVVQSMHRIDWTCAAQAASFRSSLLAEGHCSFRGSGTYFQASCEQGSIKVFKNALCQDPAVDAIGFACNETRPALNGVSFSCPAVGIPKNRALSIFLSSRPCLASGDFDLSARMEASFLATSGKCEVAPSDDRPFIFSIGVNEKQEATIRVFNSTDLTADCEDLPTMGTFTLSLSTSTLSCVNVFPVGSAAPKGVFVQALFPNTTLLQTESTGNGAGVVTSLISSSPMTSILWAVLAMYFIIL